MLKIRRKWLCASGFGFRFFNNERVKKKSIILGRISKDILLSPEGWRKKPECHGRREIGPEMDEAGILVSGNLSVI